MRDEGFYEGFYGMSPGTMDQLSSTHVPTMADSAEAMIQAKIIEEGIKKMTETAYGDKKVMDESEDKKPEDRVFDEINKSLS